MAGHDIIVMGGSAGGVETLTRMVRELPADLPAAGFVVIHFSAYATSVLPKILKRAGPLPAAHAVDGEPIRPRRIWVAPPDRHLLVKRGHVHVLRGPRENSHRPAVDPLFRTAARAYGARTVAGVLSGTLDDGSAGVVEVRRRGGMVVVQDPDDALYAGMPSNAIANAEPGFVLPASAVAETLVRLAHIPAPEAEEDPMAEDKDLSELYMAGYETPDRPGATTTGFTCPECRGALWEVPEEGPVRFRCRVGHGFSAEGLLAEQSHALESALWTAGVTLVERAALSRRLAGQALGD